MQLVSAADEAVLTAFKHQPEGASRALEAALRKHCSRSLYLISPWKCALLHNYGRALLKLGDDAPAEVPPAVQQQQQQQLQQAIFSLRLTLLKFAENKRSLLSALAGPVSSPEQAALYALSAAASSMVVASKRMDASKRNIRAAWLAAEACDKAAAERRLRMWLALAARGISSLGKQLAEYPAAVLALHAQAAAGSKQPGALLHTVCSALCGISGALETLQLPGCCADARSAKQQLLEQTSQPQQSTRHIIMKPSLRLAALAAALCLGCSLVAANDLQIWATVEDCYGKVVPGAVVRISGCVDDFGTNGISATTNGTGVASFLEHAENSIQYCWGSAKQFCTVEVVSNPNGLTYATQSLMLDQAQTCFGWFKPTYNGNQDLSKVPVTSVSFRADQKNDVSNVLTSGVLSLSETPVAPFLRLGNKQGGMRWGWEQLWNLPKGDAVMTETGTMFCGQNMFGGNIKVSLNATSLTYEITMGPGTKFTAGDVHVYASCQPLLGKNFAPGQLNCNPSNPKGCHQRIFDGWW
ncbi:hypothetical protein OEZ86_001697 [Tetradesmus obliquus]|nr:hypothetical protein OEZ86_001697 [Tetradesmus obliquus]